MAISFDVNLTIGSAIGYKRVSGSIVGPTPRLETVKGMDTNTEVAAQGFNADAKILYVTPLNTFVMSEGTTSTRQTVRMTNYGNAALTVTNIQYTFKEDVSPTFYFTPGNGLYDPISQTSSTMTILPGNTSTFQMSYYGTALGQYVNYFVIESNNSSGPYKVLTRQSVEQTFGLRVDPATTSTIAYKPGQRIFNTFAVTPIVNQQDRADIPVTLTATITSLVPGFAVEGISYNSELGVQEVRTSFDISYINDVTGIYTATLAVSGSLGVEAATDTATISIDVDTDNSLYRNLGSWVSAGSSYNSIVGLSYDIINGDRTLTIGVGMGGDGTPEYVYGGSLYASAYSLGYLADTVDYPYTGWQTVYRFPITETTPTQYVSSATTIERIPLYRIKASGPNYAQYFGNETSHGSMFIIDTDGEGGIVVGLNQVRELPEGVENTATVITINNLTRSFHYYSDVDVPTRSTQLEAGPIGDGSLTRRFYGFDNTGTVLTAIVPLPTAS